jgi:hypothetical protein
LSLTFSEVCLLDALCFCGCLMFLLTIGAVI